MIALCVMTDGRQDCISQTIPSFFAAVTEPELITRRYIHDDSSDPEYGAWLRETFIPQGFEVACESGRRGYSQAVRNAWRDLDDDRFAGPTSFTFHLEDDFMFNRPIDLGLMVDLLDETPWLAQLALRRSAWGREEGGFVEDSPSAYTECERGEQRWLEHRLYYTMTPHLYRNELRSAAWPLCDGSEVRFKDKLLYSGLPWGVPAAFVTFGFLGGVEDGANACTHIGFERKGFGY